MFPPPPPTWLNWMVVCVLGRLANIKFTFKMMLTVVPYLAQTPQLLLDNSCFLTADSPILRWEMSALCWVVKSKQSYIYVAILLVS